MVEHHTNCIYSNHINLSNEEFEKWIFCRNIEGVINLIHKKISSHKIIGLLGLVLD